MDPRRRWTGALATLGLAAALSVHCSDSTSPGDASLAATITAAEIQHWVDRLADDSMRGRATPSPGIETGATTIAAYLGGLGLAPAFPGQQFVARYPAPPTAGAGDSAPVVGAILPGSDGRLGSEYVVIIAHLDGKGIGIAIGTDSIYNGADDNASGSAGVLELAEAFAGSSPHPRRSLLFLLVTGEERGLWGSQWYVDHPTVPLSSIVAVVNLDMISRNGPGAVQAGGMDLSTLGVRLADASAAHPEIGLDVTPGPTGGSDHVPFWSRGIPFLFFFTGLHADYHQPTDEPWRIDADKAARVTRLAFHATLMVADADARPEWLAGAAAAAAARRGTP